MKHLAPGGADVVSLFDHLKQLLTDDDTDVTHDAGECVLCDAERWRLRLHPIGSCTEPPCSWCVP